ncbi:MAG: hypothetical protein K940chlam1_00922 [Candidatus Anoxychlamydiales bacterium]|nr:hypothetical protein [Candidatus Anoxychlamydiales bacterium]NGX35683.1 hypothetical protein [Candidatus Anoxychlamydiales bacterium]
MRSIFIALLTLISAFVYPDDSDDVEGLISYHPFYTPSSGNKRLSGGHIIDKSQVMPGYNAPARSDIGKKIEAFASGAYLFFQPHQKGLIFAYTSDNANSNKSQTFEMHSNYKSAFKVTLGFDTINDDWSYFARYMRFHFSKVKQLEQRVVCPWTTTFDVMTSARAKWGLKLDTIDLMVARAFYGGTHLILTPAFGFSGGFLDQDFRTDCVRESDNSSLFSADKIDSHFIGLIAELKTKYLMLYGLSLFGDISTRLFYQDFRVKNRQNSKTNQFVLFDNSINDLSFISPNLNLSAGLEWGTYFYTNTYHISFLAGYEAEIYWNQNLMMELKELRDNRFDQDAANLYFHGIVAKLELKF